MTGQPTNPERGLLNWLGLRGTPEPPEPGDIVPIWYHVPKRTYVIASASWTILAVVMFVALLPDGDWVPRLLFVVLVYALGMTLTERLSLRLPHDAVDRNEEGTNSTP